MPRRNRTPRSPRRRLPFLPPEPELTARQLAQQLVNRGLAHPVILELTEVHAPPRQGDEENR